MNAHELARLLLAGPDLPIATHANNHTFLAAAHGERLTVSLLHTYAGDHILIGNPYRDDLNPPNWYITETLGGSTR